MPSPRDCLLNGMLCLRAILALNAPVSLDYLYAASPEESAFYRGLNEGRIVGKRCPACQKVYVPPRSACPGVTSSLRIFQTWSS